MYFNERRYKLGVLDESLSSRADTKEYIPKETKGKKNEIHESLPKVSLHSWFLA